MNSKKVIVALDNNNLKQTLKIVNEIKKEAFAFKIGYEFFLNFGIDGYKKIKKISPKIFLDLKLHDIPNTVNKGIIAINKLRPLLTTIHISGGDKMMRSSLIKRRYTKILGVSILTSLNNTQTKKFYNQQNIQLLVKKFSSQAKRCGLDGIVCSPKEIKFIRKELGKKFLIVTPGIRPEVSSVKKDDQTRILTPNQAIKEGADLLVIGRPIMQAKDPLDMIKNINKSIK